MPDENDLFAKAQAEHAENTPKLTRDDAAALMNLVSQSRLSSSPTTVFMDEVRESLRRIENKLGTLERAVTALQAKGRFVGGA